MAPKEEIDRLGSESESESSILQMGRWASRTSSSFSFSFSNSAISFFKRDFSSSSSSVSYKDKIKFIQAWLRPPFQEWTLCHLCNVHSRFVTSLSALGDDCDTLLLPVCSSPSLVCVFPALLPITLTREGQQGMRLFINAHATGRESNTGTCNRRITTTVCAQWVMTFMASELFSNIWIFCVMWLVGHFISDTLLNNDCRANRSRSFRLMTQPQTPGLTQVWVTENDLPLWVTWQCTSCAMQLQLWRGYAPKNKCTLHWEQTLCYFGFNKDLLLLVAPLWFFCVSHLVTLLSKTSQSDN